MNILQEKNDLPPAYCLNLDYQIMNYEKILNEFNNILEIRRISSIDGKLHKINSDIALYTTNIELFKEIINSNYKLPYLIVIEDDVYKYNKFELYWPKIIKFINEYVDWDFISLDFLLNLDKPKLNDYNDLFYRINKSRATGFVIYNMNFLRKNIEYLSSLNLSLDMTMKFNSEFVQLIPKDLIIKQHVDKISTTSNTNTQKYEKFYNLTEKYLKTSRYRDSCIFTLVYKTYKNDLEWFKYSLLSIEKFLDLSKIFEIIVYTHDVAFSDVYKIIEELDFFYYKIIPVHYNYHGYIKQMQVKLDCYKDVTTKYVVILDSDLILQKSLDVTNLIRTNGQIEWKYLKKENDFNNAVFSVWKKAFEDSTKNYQNIYYMGNGFPFIFTTKSLENGANKFKELHNIDYEGYCINRCGHENIRVEEKTTDIFNKLSRVFSEFEYIGYYCHNFSDDYIFTSTPFCLMEKQSSINDNIDSYFIQNWSYGGINNKILKKIKNILKI